MGIVELLLLIIAALLLAEMWWISRSMRQQRIQNAIDQTELKIAELESKIENGLCESEPHCRRQLDTLRNYLDRLKAQL